MKKTIGVVKLHQTGFTLIEVMVGVAIFAVMSALIVGSIQNDSDRNAKLEAERFIAVVNEVRDEALISGRTLILTINEKAPSYGFSVFNAMESNSGVSDPLLRSRSVSPSVKLKWEVFEDFSDEEDDEIDGDESEADADVTVPRVFISPLGEMTPFKARFGGDDDDFVVELNDQGNLAMDIKPSGFF